MNTTDGKAREIAAGMQTEYAAAAVVLSALALLIIIRFGFRGVSFGGVNLSVS